MRDLRGRTAIITGAAGGIGPFITRELAAEGLNLVLASRSRDEIESLLVYVRKMNVSAIGIATDIRELVSLESLVKTAHEQFGTIDILVNNAGINNVLAFHELNSEDIQRIMSVKLIAPMLLSRMVLPGMIARGSGHIVNISSLAGEVGTPFCEPYGSSKAGLIGFTRSLRMEYRKVGVSASAVCPGFVTAGQYRKLVEETGLEAPKIVGTSRPEEVGRSVLRAIKNDIGHILVSPMRTKFFVKVANVSPQAGELLMNLLGVVDWLKNIDDIRKRRGLRGDTRP